MVSLLEKLPYIDPTEYSVWIDVGMALKSEGYQLSDWVEWSRKASNFKSVEDCEKKWDSFEGKGITGGRIDYLAREGGWSPAPAGRFRALDWDSEISDDWVPGQPVKTDSPTEQLLKYLEVLFQPDDYVGYVTGDCFQDDGRWKPYKGVYGRKAGDIIKALKRHPDDITYAIGDYKVEAGAWIRFNPLDGEGAGNKNVTEYRYALVESDNMPIDKQKELLIAMQLPVAALVYSGGKSVHAIVKVDAPDYDEYKKRVEFLYGFLKENGIEVDVANRNPSRLSRMPGVMRNGVEQTLIATNIGKASWAAWMDYVDGEKDDLPVFDSWDECVTVGLPELSPEIISGVLRAGHKLLISADSKAGKSFMLCEMALSFATGTPWLGMNVRQGRVLYINLEIDRPSFLNRMQNIISAKHLEMKGNKNLQIWNLRGMCMKMSDLAPKLIRRIKGQDYEAVIIDPLYKISHGDENSAADMASFFALFDMVCKETGTALIYAHHHAKGAAGARKMIDRSSGSGVLARDPDAQLDFTEIYIPDDQKKNYLTGYQSAWRVEFSLREFAPKDAINIIFDWPLHVEATEEFDQFGIEGSEKANLMHSSKRTTRDSRYEKFRAAYDFLDTNQLPPKKEDLAKFMNVSVKTVQRYVEDFADEFELKDGYVILKLPAEFE